MTLPTYTPTEAATAIRACLAANESANVDRVGRIMLDQNEAPLRRYLVTATGRHCEDHFFGANWHGPALDSLIRECASTRAEAPAHLPMQHQARAA